MATSAERRMLAVDCLPLGRAGDGVRIRADLLPPTTWGSNLRTILRPTEWDRLRFDVADAASNRCEVCGAVSRRAGRETRPDCHEVWTFGELGSRPVQRLDRLIALCKACHNVQHIGRAIDMGEVLTTLRTVNGWTAAQAKADVRRARARFSLLARLSFDLDLVSLRGKISLADHPGLVVPAAERARLRR